MVRSQMIMVSLFISNEMMLVEYVGEKSMLVKTKF